MTQREQILNELNELKSSIGAMGHPDYRVPTGYFEGLAGEIIKRVRALDSDSAQEELENLSPLLSGISKKTPFSVPEDYFSKLAKKMESIPDAGYEPEELSPILSGLKNKTTYTVPEGYFENFSAQVSNKLNRQETKVISITSRKWFRYAAAASVVAFVATLFFIIGKKEPAVDPDTRSYAWVEKNLKKVSTDEISEFVELATLEKTDMAKLDTRDEISGLLKDVSDKEIEDFLKETQEAENSNDDDVILN